MGVAYQTKDLLVDCLSLAGEEADKWGSDINRLSAQGMPRRPRGDRRD